MGIEVLTGTAVQGNTVALKATQQGHFGITDQETIGEASGFGKMLMNSLQEVSSHQNEASDLSVQALVNPESVEAHDVTIAMAKANLSLSIAKNVVDRVIQGYKDITNLR